MSDANFLKGVIESIDEKGGIIVSQTGEKYRFSMLDWKDLYFPEVDREVKFKIINDKPKEIFLTTTKLKKFSIEHNIKVFGIIGAVGILISGMFGPMGIVIIFLPLIFLSIALKRISDVDKSYKVFRKWIYFILFLIVGIPGGLYIGCQGMVLIFEALEFENYSPFYGYDCIFLIIVVFIFLGIILKQVFYGVYEITGEKLFKTAGTLFFFRRYFKYSFNWSSVVICWLDLSCYRVWSFKREGELQDAKLC